METNTRIIDHCFVPQEDEQLLDRCAYNGCDAPELKHEWTVDADRANPKLPLQTQKEPR